MGLQTSKGRRKRASAKTPDPHQRPVPAQLCVVVNRNGTAIWSNRISRSYLTLASASCKTPQVIRIQERWRNLAQQNVQMNKKLLFVVGAPRSGTTWVQLLISANDHVATANETHLFSSYLTSLLTSWNRFETDRRQIGISQLISHDEWMAQIRRVSEIVLSRIAEAKPAASIVMEKTPDHARYVRQILEIFPDAYILHVVRDPRSVVASLRDAAKAWGKHWAASGVIENALLWQRNVRAVVESRVTQTQFLQIRYEDLKGNGAEVLHDVFCWLGIEASVAECAEIIDRYRISKLQNRQAADAGWNLKSEPDRFYRRGEVEGWRNELRPAQVAAIEHLNGDLMESLGYSRQERRYKALRAIFVHKLLSAARWRIDRLIRTI